MILVIFVLLITVTQPAAINRILPKMNLEQHIYPVEVYKPSYKEQFKYQFSQSLHGQISITSTDPQIQFANQCSFQHESIEVKRLSTFSNPFQKTRSNTLPRTIYLSSKKLVYSINAESVLSVYNYSNDNRITKQASIRLQQLKNQQNSASPHIVSSHDDKFVHIFSSSSNPNGYRLQSKFMIGKIAPIKTDNVNIEARIIKIKQYKNKLFILTNSSTMIIFNIEDSGELQMISSTKLGDLKSDIVDFDISQQLKCIFVIGKTSNINVYNISVDKDLTLYDTIHFNNSQNYNIKTYNNRIYYSFFNKSNAIIQLLYNQTIKQAMFIRYYHTYKQKINTFSIQAGILTVLTKNRASFHLTNIDPRLVKKVDIKAKHHIKATQFIKLSNSHYLFLNHKELSVYKIQLHPPKLKCRISKSSLFLNITYLGIEKSCVNYNITPRDSQFIPFYHVCESTKNIMIQIIQPKQFEHQMLLFIVLGLYFVFLVFGCCWMKIWRDSKIRMINNLQRQIDEMVSSSIQLQSNRYEGEIINYQFQQEQSIKYTKDYQNFIFTSYQLLEISIIGYGVKSISSINKMLEAQRYHPRLN